MSGFSFEGRIWMNASGKPFLGSGKIELLVKIRELGSLRKAALEINMSYRQAWYSLNQVNKMAPEPLVILHRGGKNGGMAQITDYGLNMIEKFNQIVKDFRQFLELRNKSLDL